MMKVLEVMALSTGGVGRHVAFLAERLGRSGLEIDVAAPAAVEIAMPKPHLPLEIPGGAGPSLWNAARVVAAKKQLGGLIAERAYDVVHAHGLRAALLTLDAAGETPVIVTLHNLVRRETSGRIKSIAFRRGEHRVLERAQHVFAVSQEMADDLTRRVPAAASKVELLPIGLPVPSASRPRAEVRAELGVGAQPLLITVARLAPQKALDVMLEAVARVEKAVLAIVGRGQLEPELRALSKDLGIADRVRFLGWKQDVGDYLGAADAFVLSSTWEARALAVQEAILAEVPVVSTAVGGMPELIEDRVSGLLVPPNDPEALAGAIRAMLADPEQARTFARRAKEALTSGYSEVEMLSRVRRAYEGAAR